METWKIFAVDTDHTLQFKDGTKVHGVKWLMINDPQPGKEAARYYGCVWREQFISDDRLKTLGVEPMPGQTITMYFNRYGDVAKVDVVAA